MHNNARIQRGEITGYKAIPSIQVKLVLCETNSEDNRDRVNTVFTSLKVKKKTLR